MSACPPCTQPSSERPRLPDSASLNSQSNFQNFYSGPLLANRVLATRPPESCRYIIPCDPLLEFRPRPSLRLSDLGSFPSHPFNNMSSGLTRRRGGGGGGGPSTEGESSNGLPRTDSSTNFKDTQPETSYENSENGHKIAFDPRDISESAERSKQPKLTLMEEVLLLGLKDKQVRPRPITACSWKLCLYPTDSEGS